MSPAGGFIVTRDEDWHRVLLLALLLVLQGCAGTPTVPDGIPEAVSEAVPGTGHLQAGPLPDGAIPEPVREAPALSPPGPCPRRKPLPWWSSMSR